MRAPAEAVWRERFERFAVEQGSVAEFCRREGVSLPSFYRWRKMLATGSARRGTRPQREPRFLPVEIPVSLLTTGVRMELPGGAVVCFPPDVAQDVLATAIRAACLARVTQEVPTC
jgi:hypothetical protein